jgi:RimJ/RimL family protein N-acetyltransferase
VRLETERLILRVPEESDVDAWTALYARPEVQRFLNARPSEHVAEYIRVVRERHAADGFGILAASEKRTAALSGARMLVWDERTWTPTTLREAGAHGEVEIGGRWFRTSGAAATQPRPASAAATSCSRRFVAA